MAADSVSSILARREAYDRQDRYHMNSVLHRLITILAAITAAHAWAADTVTVSLSGASAVCREIKLPQWKAPRLPSGSPAWRQMLLDAPISSDWDFRRSDGGILVRLFGHLSDLTAGPRYYSPDLYAISLQSGRVTKAREREWADAQPYQVFRESPLSGGLRMKRNDRLTYRGRDFARRGLDWPLLSDKVGRLAQNGRFLAVYGWDGHRGGYGDLVQSGGKFDGNYYVDVYDTDSGASVLSLQGHFHGSSDFDDLFRESAWVSSSYYVFPLNCFFMNEFVLCDLARVRGTRSQ